MVEPLESADAHVANAFRTSRERNQADVPDQSVGRGQRFRPSVHGRARLEQDQDVLVVEFVVAEGIDGLHNRF